MATRTEHDEGTALEARPRLVLADDDAVVRSTLALQLRNAFSCVGAAADAEEAIALAAQHRPDVAILDVSMPGGGARRATREIRAVSPETAIVILSGDEMREEVVALLNLGAVTYLRKGVDARSLLDKVSAAITTHRVLRGDEPARPVG